MAPPFSFPQRRGHDIMKTALTFGKGSGKIGLVLAGIRPIFLVLGNTITALLRDRFPQVPDDSQKLEAVDFLILIQR